MWQIFELRENLEDMRKENEALKDANQQLLTSAFSMEREREFREKERALKIQIAQLEATLKSDVGEKGTILDRLTAEREQYDKLNTESRDMQVRHLLLFIYQDNTTKKR
jgi:protein fantom